MATGGKIKLYSPGRPLVRPDPPPVRMRTGGFFSARQNYMYNPPLKNNRAQGVV